MDKAFEIIVNQFLQNEWAIIFAVSVLILSIFIGLGLRKFFKSAEREYKDWKNYKRRK